MRMKENCPIFSPAGLAWWILGSSGNLWSREYDDQGSPAPNRRPMVRGRSYRSRRGFRDDLDVSARTRNHGNNGVNVVYRIQVRGPLQRIPRRAISTDRPVQHSLLPTHLHSQLLLTNICVQPLDLRRGPDEMGPRLRP